MAESLFNKYAKHSIASSAGSNPAKKIHPFTIKVMKEKGIDFKNKNPVGYAPFLNEIFDIIVKMGCKEECPITSKEKTIKWDIPDPKGKDIEEFRRVSNIIEQKVKILLREIGD